MAAALGGSLGMVREASTGEATVGVPVMYAQRQEMAMADAPTPIAPAEQVVRASVSLVYHLIGGGS